MDFFLESIILNRYVPQTIYIVSLPFQNYISFIERTIYVLIFIAISFFLFKITVQSSSQICPSEINDEDFNLGNTVVVCAAVESLFDNGIIPRFVGAIVSASGYITDGPEYGVMFSKHCSSSSRQ